MACPKTPRSCGIYRFTSTVHSSCSCPQSNSVWRLSERDDPCQKHLRRDPFDLSVFYPISFCRETTTTLLGFLLLWHCAPRRSILCPPFCLWTFNEIGLPMDDQTFDEKTARDWITSVESSKVRSNDIFPKLSAWVDRTFPSEILEIGSGQGICSDHIGLPIRNFSIKF
jgi:hypothetical protein